MFKTLVLLYIATLVAGDFTPTAPGPGDSYAAGSMCPIKWNVGDWRNVSIVLMSGSNGEMKRVTAVANGLDGSDPSLTPYNWTCPEVSPYSAIYFYQFTNGDDLQNSKWTTRFQITSPSGAYTPPEHDSQPNGDPIPWGTGTLSNSNSTSTPSNSSSTTKDDASTSEDSFYTTRKLPRTASPERQASPTLSLPANSPVGYSASMYSGARSEAKGQYWSASLSAVCIVWFVSWLM
ncbi:hypothetical protein AAF712_001932 [Marasmius tenuissimus]|uniref:Yeast cell wall synthesis Kre9/Knh1-like N-terminal domain-containing protein n=1 Tax=Marasmius tenuissimus TaxID=585030 RepID=A0ABR3ABH8_9AGAR